jgi:hypothetical protein
MRLDTDAREAAIQSALLEGQAARAEREAARAAAAKAEARSACYGAELAQSKAFAADVQARVILEHAQELINRDGKNEERRAAELRLQGDMTLAAIFAPEAAHAAATVTVADAVAAMRRAEACIAARELELAVEAKFVADAEMAGMSEELKWLHLEAANLAAAADEARDRSRETAWRGGKLALQKAEHRVRTATQTSSDLATSSSAAQGVAQLARINVEEALAGYNRSEQLDTEAAMAVARARYDSEQAAGMAQAARDVADRASASRDAADQGRTKPKKVLGEELYDLHTGRATGLTADQSDAARSVGRALLEMHLHDRRW